MNGLQYQLDDSPQLVVHIVSSWFLLKLARGSSVVIATHPPRNGFYKVEGPPTVEGTDGMTCRVGIVVRWFRIIPVSYTMYQC